MTIYIYIYICVAQLLSSLNLSNVTPQACQKSLMALFHCMVRYGSVRFTFGGFSTGYCTWYFFSTTSAEVPSEPYRYQNVTCKLCCSLIGRRESSLLRHWTCDTRPSSTVIPARFKSAQPAKDRTQLLFKQMHIFASTTKWQCCCLLRKYRRSSRW